VADLSRRFSAGVPPVADRRRRRSTAGRRRSAAAAATLVVPERRMQVRVGRREPRHRQMHVFRRKG